MESRLRNILLYALGMLNEESSIEMRSSQFFERMTKYMRSIGLYGDSPFMMCNYGSSEYSQAFSRIGSLYRNVYIVNEELHYNSVKVEDDLIKQIDINYNDPPIKLPENGGVIVSTQYLDTLKELIPEFSYEIESTSQCLRMTLLSKKPLVDDSLSTFTISPGTYDNKNPIRIYQQNHFIEATPRGTYLIMLSMVFDDYSQAQETFKKAVHDLFGYEI